MSRKEEIQSAYKYLGNMIFKFGNRSGMRQVIEIEFRK